MPGSPPTARKLGWGCKPKPTAEMLPPQHGTGMPGTFPLPSDQHQSPHHSWRWERHPVMMGTMPQGGQWQRQEDVMCDSVSPSSASSPPRCTQSHFQHPSRGMPGFLQGGRSSRTSIAFAAMNSSFPLLSPGTKQHPKLTSADTQQQASITEPSINTSSASSRHRSHMDSERCGAGSTGWLWGGSRQPCLCEQG